ncbi:MAG: GAF domain-containing protein [Bacteroidales bacterium]|nr:GAF domain-containing protein [Bacteroidales bacterium]
MTKLKFIQILVFILYFGILNAQTDKFNQAIISQKKTMSKSWSVEDGLISNAVLKITKTPESYLFMATYNGIAIFDGKKFSSYTSKNTEILNADVIYDFCYRKDSSIWIATGNGIFKFKNKKFYRVKELKSLNDINVQKIECDNNNNLWIGTTSKGLYKFSNEKLTKIEGIESLDKNIISLIYKDLEGIVWIGTERGDLYKYKNNKFETVFIPKKINGIFAALQRKKKGEHYFGTRDGIYILENNNLKLINNDINFINDIQEDKKGLIWFATNSGLFFYNPLEKHKFNKIKSLSNQIIRTIYFDNEDIIWIGSYRKGLLQIRETAFEQISLKDKNIDDTPSYATLMNDSNIWISTDEGNIFVYNDDNFTKLNLKTNLKGSRIKNIYSDSKNNIWICSYKGLLKYNKNSEVCANIKNGFPDNTIREIIEDKEGNYYVSTRQSGIYKIDENFNVLKKFNTDNGLASNFIMSLVFDKNQRLFVSSKNGVNIIENDSITTHYNEEKGLAENMIFNIYIDKQDIIWVATINGLSRIENNKIVNFNNSNGLSESKIFDIVEDNFGNFWMPIEKGLIKVDKKSLNDFANKKITKIYSTIYAETDGINNPQYVGASKMYKTKSGKIIFCTISAINILDPSVINSFKSNYNLFIEQISTENDTFPITKNFLNIPAYSKYIKINFSYIDYIYPDKVHFKYKLEPFDKEWQDPEEDRFAKYTNLHPGNYNFIVQAEISNLNGKKITSSKKFEISPAFYQTTWFKLISAFTILLTIYLIYTIRIRSIKINQQLLEKEIKERTKEIRRQKGAIEKQNKELEFQKSEIAQKNDEILLQSHEIEQSFLQLKSLSDLGKEITSYLSKEKIIKTVYKNINYLMDSTIFGIGIFDKEKNTIVFNSAIYKNKEIKPFEISVDNDNCLICLSFNEDKEIFSNNIKLDYPNYIETFPNITSFQTVDSSIIIPLKIKNEKIGIITAQSFRKNSYSEYHVDLIKNLAVYIGIAIENAKVYAQISEQKDELQQVNTAKDKLFSLIGHDLRGPVGTIKTFLDIILENPDMSNQEQTLQILKTMQQSLESAYTLLDNLLLWARSQRGQIEFEPQNFIIEEAINESINIAAESAKSKNIKFIKKISDNENVFADKNMITTVIRNLISNAIKFTSSDGNIVVKTKKTHKIINSVNKELVEISIIDDGIGISKQLIDKILNLNETFSTLGTEKEKGSGLGINICLDFLKRHNQKLIIESKETNSNIEKGSIFKFYLPTENN